MALSSIVIPPDRARDMRAAALSKHVGEWPRHTLKVAWGAFEAGTIFRRATGSNGERYLVNAVVCECPDYQEAHNICKHIRAVVRWEHDQAVARIHPLYQRFEALFPVCPCGDLADGGADGLCFVCASEAVGQR